MDLIGWTGNILIIVGLWGVGSRRRNAFIFSMVGEVCYILRSYIGHDWALFVVCWVFLLMAVRGYILWGRKEK